MTLETTMKVMIVGDWHSQIHEEAIYRSMLDQGIDVIKFSWHQYFYSDTKNKHITILSRIQRKLLFGNIVNSINFDLIKAVVKNCPQYILIYRGTHIYADTIKKIKKINHKIKIISYNNDDPFSKKYPWWFWRHYKNSIILDDLSLFYRPINLLESKKYGVKKSEIFYPWFVPKLNFPLSNALSEYECDIVFVGHYENDERLSYLESISALGYKLKIYGPEKEWNKVIKKSKELKKYYPIRSVYGDDYNKAIGSAKIALCFFSKLNRDVYTRRCFEIPAAKVLLVASYTEELKDLYEENREIILFKNLNELCIKIKNLLKNPILLESIANEGYNRAWKSGYDINSRTKVLIKKMLDL